MNVATLQGRTFQRIAGNCDRVRARIACLVHTGRGGRGPGLESFAIPSGEAEMRHPNDGKQVAEEENTSEGGDCMQAQMPSATVMYGEETLLLEHEDGEFTHVQVM